jgi:hypothetical protein
MPTLPVKPHISVIGHVDDWVSFERIRYGDPASHSLLAHMQEDCFRLALNAPVATDANTNFWFNTGQNTVTGRRMFGFAGGAEHYFNSKSDITATPYTRQASSTQRQPRHTACRRPPVHSCL